MFKVLNRMLVGLALVGLGLLSAAHAGPSVVRLADGSGPTAESLAAGLLGSGVTLVGGSATYTGDAVASGWFTGGGTDPASTIGIDAGVVLTTGDAANHGGPNYSGFCCNDGNSSAGSALLDPMTHGEGSYNASVLSFQFVPTASSVTLRYVFASEEYNAFVGPFFNGDVVGVFVNGVNAALVPGSSSAVSINTINCVAAANCGLYRDNATFTEAIDSQFNGMTVVMTLTAPVLAGQVNTIQIGIADSFDMSYDSAIYLQQGSLAAIPEPASLALLAFGLVVIGCARRVARARV